MSQNHNKIIQIIVVVLLLICTVSLSALLLITLGDNSESESVISGQIVPTETSIISPNATTTPEERAVQVAQNERANVIFILNTINEQKSIEDGIKAEVESGLYSFENPLSITNPYGLSPLTALIGFTTSEPVKISVFVQGKDENTDISFDLSEFNTSHYIPIYGLYEGMTNFVTLTATNENGEIVSTKEHEIQTEFLGDPYNTLVVKTEFENADEYSSGLNFTTQYIKSAFDINGDFRWALSPHFLLGGNYEYVNGNFLLSTGANHMGDTIFVEINPLGKIFSTYYTPYGSHHHIEIMPDGNFIVTGTNGETVQDFLYEIHAETGTVSNSIDYKDILQRMRKVPTEGEFQVGIDWLHMNAAIYDEASDTVIISSNMQSAVVKHDYETNEINWILSDPTNWANMYEKYLLTPIGENFEYTYGQHLPQILPDYDENPDTIDLLIFDNGRGRNLFNETNNELFSRMVHYRIDEVNMTVEQIWQYGKENGEELFSIWGGSAFLLPNENNLGLFSVSAKNVDVYYPHAVEVNTENEVVWEAMIYTKSGTGQFGENRLERRDLYTQSANELKIGEEIQDFIPETIWDKYNFSEVE